MAKDSLNQKISIALRGLAEGRSPTTTPRQLMLRIGRKRRSEDACERVRTRLEEHNLCTVPDFQECGFDETITFEWIEHIKTPEERAALAEFAARYAEDPIGVLYPEIHKPGLLRRFLNFLTK